MKNKNSIHEKYYNPKRMGFNIPYVIGQIVEKEITMNIRLNVKKSLIFFSHLNDAVNSFPTLR